MHFIELHSKDEDGKRFLVNIHRIASVDEREDGTVVICPVEGDDSVVPVTEGWDTMVGLLTGLWAST